MADVKITKEINMQTRMLKAALAIAVDTASGPWQVCNAYIKAAHAKEFAVNKANVLVILNAERAALAKLAGKAADTSEIAGSRVSERRRVLDLHKWSCCDTFMDMIKSWSLSFANMSDLALWLRKHAGPKVKGKPTGWPDDAKKPPHVDVVMAALKAARAARNAGRGADAKPPTAKELAKAGLTSDAVKATASMIAGMAKLRGKFGPLDTKGMSYLTAALNSLNAFSPIAERIMKARKASEEEAE